MKYRVAITKPSYSPDPFWQSPWYEDELRAHRVAKQNQHLVDQHQWDHVIVIETQP